MRKIIKLILLLVVIINLFIIGKYYKDLKTNSKIAKNNSQLKIVDEKKQIKTGTKKVNRFKDFIKKNKDFKCFIKIPNTDIDYPVVQSKDNKFYLQRDYLKNKNIAGSIFLDFRNNISNDLSKSGHNVIFYGHNMKNETMFGELDNFRKKDFFKKNKFIIVDDGLNKFKYKIFSIYLTKPSFNYLKTNFNSRKEYSLFLNTIKNKSLFNTNIKLNSKDTIITLSTCAYDFDDARLVIHAKLVK